MFEASVITNQSVNEQQKTLRNLREKAKTAMEEQGVNILYLSFGFLRWREDDNSDQYLLSLVAKTEALLGEKAVPNTRMTPPGSWQRSRKVRHFWAGAGQDKAHRVRQVRGRKQEKTRGMQARDIRLPVVHPLLLIEPQGWLVQYEA